ncbi:dicarboxylate/amino acid:cation symporter [Legionella jamestowniensis]|uniref:Sodium:dicarboxylate symporter protein n=1 Tax=Legionella jamestowniensis TaxID=455 RepID=A0A0W0UIL5_9GAMM|nr:sodium:dicarboxylate symporter protein [Legionella jamestowniensis]OCH99466.1 sodium:proton antiporter [Legionella jamestowniensis]SFL61321.1 Na+/H+-dicarboxylate symporter [Legionella jamestowniensis DSM 19215]
MLRSYLFSLMLLLSILLGGIVGYSFEQVKFLKPIGDIFLNLILTAIVPLVFFSIASAITKAGSLGRFGKIISRMIVVFLVTGLIAALYALLIVKIFPLTNGFSIELSSPMNTSVPGFSEQLVGIFSVTNFSQLLSHEHISALIVFSILVGLALASLNKKDTTFVKFLQEGESLFMRVISLIMYFAPIGFFAYFAVLVNELGPKLVENYFRIAIIYYVSSLLYFVVVFSIYAYGAARLKGFQLFWKNLFLPATTALATCSSAASIPANLLATKNMGVSCEISETVIPLGSIIHKDGSVIGGVFKIAFLFAIFQLDFNGLPVLLLAMMVSMLVGTVMGAIPSGGMVGELLILAVYGFPSTVLLAVAAISVIIDPIATMLNVTGNTVSSMLIARLVDGRNWFIRKIHS